MATYTVQDYSCIAILEDLQGKTGLGSGATFEIVVPEDGSSVTLNTIRPSQLSDMSLNASCVVLKAPAN